MSFSRSGSCYASTAKLINCLIACLFMLTIAFAAIPYFVVSHSKGKIATRGIKANMNRTKIAAAKRHANPGIIYVVKPYVSRTSSGNGKAVVSKYGRIVKVQIVSGRNQGMSPVNFEARTKKEMKRGKPDET
jgi:hypothetical protein